jgi:A/G-specific adenine glycosylase
MPNETQKDWFRRNLLEWFGQNLRPMPWKGEKNPYLVWLSEIILQQTRVEQGLPYFERFRANYPSVTDLANAPENEVMKHWEGLGYYSRARNLHSTAKHIAYNLNGSFPNTYEGLLSLKGVGAYTAAAIASFAFDLPHAVVDGNVFRVLSRIFGITTPIDSTEGKRTFTTLANSLLISDRPADFNQAMMDFGATCCKPAIPLCADCPMQTHCVAYQQDKVQDLPIKSKKLVRKTRYFHYLFLKTPTSQTFIQKRKDHDIWRDLYEFPMLETDCLIPNFEDFLAYLSENFEKWGDTEGEDKSENNALIILEIKNLLFSKKYNLIPQTAPIRQQLTHQQIVATFWTLQLHSDFSFANNAFLCVDEKNLNNFALPKIMISFLENNNKTKNLLLF